MRARLTRLTCLSPGLAGLACPLCRSFGWPLLVHRDPCMQHRGHRRKAAREPMAIHSCVHLLWVHPLRYHLLELLLSFSFSILPPTLLLFFILHCLLLLLLFLCTTVMKPHPDPVSDLCSSGQEAAVSLLTFCCPVGPGAGLLVRSVYFCVTAITLHCADSSCVLSKSHISS